MNTKALFTNFFQKWFRSVDLISITLIIFLMILGLLFVTTASPNVAKLKNLNEFYFIKKHYFFTFFSLFFMIIFSLFSTKGLINISYIGFTASIILITILLLISGKNNGSTRWLNLLGYSFQPSEFLKPFTIIIFSILLNLRNNIILLGYSLNGKNIAFLLLLFISSLILAQPNFSMFVILFLVFMSQYFTAGINLKFFLFISFITLLIAILAYLNLAHVKYRVDSFLSPNTTHFQVEKSLEAYQSGGLLGKGPGEGTIKNNIPDSHTDFIFPVIAEEYGALVCIFLVCILLVIFFRGIININNSYNKFKITSCVGLLTLFIIQAFINMAVSMKLIPTTGVTFPFLSYGGSSIISMGIVMGMVLSLTKKKFKEKGLIYEN
ncbi:MAG: hypothetical protein CMJ06_04165 [Pelagibacterales bacterium]|nr:hypothetical protein [Pelagibacterales bacterium]OUU62046.1 MAG: hypothetical protein CBC22_05615 [Alphaproteobacteria bacterium TMED62]|tara:strand:- start:932 stop:2071 length:1140 start_codon:yes stop_codon:yes gene_type:complete